MGLQRRLRPYSRHGCIGKPRRHLCSLLHLRSKQESSQTLEFCILEERQNSAIQDCKCISEVNDSTSEQ